MLRMRVRITRQPTGTVCSVSLDSLRLGQVYELSASIAEFLVLEQCAAIEMRRAPRSRRSRSSDRRRHPFK
jgi:hypothetical protein